MSDIGSIIVLNKLVFENLKCKSFKSSNNRHMNGFFSPISKFFIDNCLNDCEGFSIVGSL